METNQTEAVPMTVSYHLPIAIAEQAKYSVDASLTYEVLEGCDPKAIKLEAFNPNNPNICFRQEPRS